MPEPSARIGIVGAGLMGLGIAQAVAAGAQVVLCRRDPDAARERFYGAGRRQVARGRLGEADAAGIRERVTIGAAERLAGCGLVIESALEDPAAKSTTLAAIERVAPAALIATNTSGLSIARLAEALREPSRFLGLHFFSPSPRLRELAAQGQGLADYSGTASCA